MPDYLPQSDGEFNDWFTNFNALLSSTPAAFGETAGSAAAIDAAFVAWQASYSDNLSKQNAAQAAKATKDNDRAAGEALIRPAVQRMQVYSGMDDAKRVTMRITLRDTIHTSAAAPVSKPVLVVDTRDRLRHTINFADVGTPTSKAKPAGVSGCEIWMKVGGPPPADKSECTYLATDTRTPYVVEFDGGQAGQTAHYMARWLNTKHEPGPWAETVSATIGA